MKMSGVFNLLCKYFYVVRPYPSQAISVSTPSPLGLGCLGCLHSIIR
jgi:hypothetical protein